MQCAVCGGDIYSSELSYSSRWRNKFLNVKLNYRCRISGFSTQLPVCLSCVTYHNKDSRATAADCRVSDVDHRAQVERYINENFQRDVVRSALQRMHKASLDTVKYNPEDWWISLK